MPKNRMLRLLAISILGLCGPNLANAQQTKELFHLVCDLEPGKLAFGNVEVISSQLTITIKIDEGISQKGNKYQLSTLLWGDEITTMPESTITDDRIVLKTNPRLSKEMLKQFGWTTSYSGTVNRRTGRVTVEQWQKFGLDMKSSGIQDTLYVYRGKCAKANVAARKF